MKKILLAALAALMLTPAFSADYPTVKKEYEIRDFTGIKVSHTSRVKLVKAEKCGLTIETDSECIGFVELSYLEDGTLQIAYNRLPFKYKNTKRSHLKITAYLPNLNAIDLGGASELVAEGDFTTSAAMKTFNLLCGSASTVDSLKINAPRANLQISGASKTTLDGNFGELIADISGASKVVLSGAAGQFDLEVSGASGLNSEALEADIADVKVSGASKANIKVLKNLEVKVSGASACTYIAPNPITLEVKGVTGASTFKKKN